MSELQQVEELVHNMFCQDWDLEKSKNSFALSRDFGDGKETIKVSYYSDFKVWYVTIKILDRLNEIHTSRGINAHSHRQLSKKESLDIQLAFQTELEDIGHNELKSLGNIKFGTVVENESCVVKKPHRHHYITNFIVLKTTDLTNIIPFIRLRYEFFGCA